MSAEKTDDKLKLTADQAVIFADTICGVSSQKTAERLGIHKNTVLNQRKRINKFLNKKFDVDEFRPRMVGLVPLAIESLAYHLANKNPEITMKFLQGISLLAKDYEELQELNRTISANSGRADTHIHLDMGGNGNGNGNGSGSSNPRFQRLAAIYTEAGKNTRLDPIDN